ncbi:hypothetical protein TNCV_1287611 [Trichonephila clavipes]|nr:hypothetical protein TNCV_1287611 [Trichonephila clavipes]
MGGFTIIVLVDMYLIYGLAERNALAAEKLYCKMYPQIDAPDRRMFLNLNFNLWECESLRGNEIAMVEYDIEHIPSMHGTKCVGYGSMESEYFIGSSSHFWLALTIPITL